MENGTSIMKKIVTKWIDNLNDFLANMSADANANPPVNGTIIRYDGRRAYIKKKHFCFECGEELETKRREVVVNSRSEEAKNYDFQFGDEYAHGNIRFVSFYFECPKCGKSYEIKDYIKLEKVKKRKLQ